MSSRDPDVAHAAAVDEAQSKRIFGALAALQDQLEETAEALDVFLAAATAEDVPPDPAAPSIARDGRVTRGPG